MQCLGGAPEEASESFSSKEGASSCTCAFRLRGSGLRVQGAGFRVQGSGFRVQGSGSRVQGSVFRVQGSGFGVRGSGCRYATHLAQSNPSKRSSNAGSDRLCVGWPYGEVSRGEKMLCSTTDPEWYITEYTLVYED